MKLNELSFSKKIIFGFLSVLLMLVIVSAISIRAILNASTGFENYQEMALDNGIASTLQADMLLMQLNVKEYLISHSEEDLKQVEEYREKMREALNTANKSISNPERVKKIDTIEEEFKGYADAFKKVYDLMERRDVIVKTILDVNGPIMVDELEKIMAFNTENIKSGKTDRERGDRIDYLTGEAQVEILEARISLLKFLSVNDDQHIKAVEENFSVAGNHMREARPLFIDPVILQRFDYFEKARATYLGSFEELTKVIRSRNDIIEKNINPVGPEIANLAEEVQNSVEVEQKEVGPKLHASNQSAETWIVVVSVLSLLGGLMMVYLIVGAVMRQLGGDPQKIADIAKSISENKLNITFDSGQKTKEGVYKDMEIMTGNLTGMIRDISKGVETLSESSRKLTDISKSMAEGVEQTTEKSNKVAMSSESMSSHMSSVAAAMEEASTNISMVATATEEMTATVSEIAKNSEKANGISQSAVSQTKNASDKVSELGRSANEIGKVVETITEISEQVNLLALNATIEAARAGEAGKGFAVVANEIKDLASQTASATMEIKQKIEDIQSSTNGTVTEIKNISEVIHEVNEIVTTIATAVEEQTATTSEIASNIAQASQGIKEISEKVHESSNYATSIAADIQEVNRAAEEMKESSAHINTSSDEISSFSNHLKGIVTKFTF